MDMSRDLDRLAKCHAHWRRVGDRVWLALSLIVVLSGAVVWSFSRNMEHLYSGLFYSVFPFVGLLYNHFILFHPGRDPLKTQQKLEDLNRKHRKDARTVSHVNGSILLIASPVLLMTKLCEVHS